MVMAKNICIHVSPNTKDLIQKLQAIAEHEHLALNTLAKQILYKRANEIVNELGIDCDSLQTQSASAG